MLPNPEVIETLKQAYDPCPAFKTVCHSMRWKPEMGNVPRGYCGAIDQPSKVRLILVCAEPGNPHTEQQHGTDGMALIDYIKSAYSYSWKCLETKKELFHKNVRHIIDLCFPGRTFIEQMRYTWRTNAVLCSAEVECGRVHREIERECVDRYLKNQLKLFSNAQIIALGTKAKDRLKRAGVNNFISAWAAAPPGCNRPEAKNSWIDASRKFKKEAQ